MRAAGLGAALKVFFHSDMKSGVGTVPDLIGFDAQLEGVDLVITGEGGGVLQERGCAHFLHASGREGT